MSNKRITDLTELTTPTTDDVFPVVDIATNTTTKVQLANLPVQTAVTTALATKQATLVSGTNIKTVNSTSLLGSGDIPIPIVTPSGVSGAIQFSNGSAFASDASNLFWDDTNNRLGVGTNAPTAPVQINYTTTGLNLNSTEFTATAISFTHLGITRGSFGVNSNSGEFRWGVNSGGYFPTIYSNNVEAMRIDTAQNVNIGATALGARVGIKGSGSTSATTSLLVQNSAGTQMMKMGDAGYFFAGNSSANTYIINDPSDAGYFATQGPIFLQNGGTTSVAIIGQRMSIGKGASYADASATLELSSTTRGFLPPRMTTTQKNAIASPATGLVVYDSTTNKLQCYNGSTWNDLF